MQAAKSTPQRAQQQATPKKATNQNVVQDTQDQDDDEEEQTNDGEEDEGEEGMEMESEAGGAQNTAQGAAGQGAGKVGQTAKDTQNTAGGAAKGAKQTAQGAQKSAQNTADDAEEEEEGDEGMPIGSVKPDGSVVQEDGSVVGSLAKGDPKKLAGNIVDDSGDVISKDGDIVGAAEPNAEGAVDGVGKEVEKTAGGATEEAKGAADKAGLGPITLDAPLDFQKDGQVADSNGQVLGKLADGDPKELAKQGIQTIDGEGQLLGEDGNVLGKVELEDPTKLKDLAEGQAQKAPGTDDLADLGVINLNEPLDFQKDGQVADSNGQVLGKLTEGDPKKLAKEGVKSIDGQGQLLGEDGTVLGKVELTDPEKLKELAEEQAQEEGQKIPSPDVLEGLTVNRSGKVTDASGGVIGEVIEGDPKKMAGRTCDAEGQIWDDRGKVMGRAQALPEDQRIPGEEAPFESFPDAKVQRSGDVVFEGQVVGKVVEGELKKLEGKAVDQDGLIYDKNGNTIGRAERIEDEEPEAEVDQSILAGKRVNKAGNVTDDKGSLFGRLVEGDPKKLAGKMCDNKGQVYDEMGKVVGRAEIVPESERESKKEGPFGNYAGSKVRKDGKVVSDQNEVIGRLIEGDPKQLAGAIVDEDGDVIDKNGSCIGKAERWEEEEVEKKKHPCAGKTVNAEGNVLDESGEIIGKLTDGKLEQCKGLEVDDDGDISNQKGQSIGHVTRIEDVKPEKSQEELDAEKAAEEERLAAEEKAEKDKKLANRISYTIDGTLQKVKPILSEITDQIEKAEATPKEERDEEKLVKDVKPLIEEGGQILQDCNDEIRAMDPDGRIQQQAKERAAEGEATPEEKRVSELLRQLSGDVQHTIENAKKKLAGMPHAQKGINPLWALLTSPLGQILAAVGLLLSGVLGLVGQLLGGLGLGGLFDRLIGGLGIDKIIKGLTGGK